MHLETQPPALPRRWHSSWLFYSLLALAAWTAWGLVARAASDSISSLGLQTICVVGLFPLSLMHFLTARDGRIGLNRGTGYGFLTGLCAAVGNMTMLAALEKGGSAVVVLPVTGMYPLVTVVLAMIVLREPLTRNRMFGIALALCALWLFNWSDAKTSAGNSSPVAIGGWTAWALCALVAFGVAALFQKLGATGTVITVSVLAFSIAFAVISLLTVCFMPGAIATSRQGVFWSILFGVLTWLGVWSGFQAYREGPAMTVTVLTALYPALVALLAVPLFHESIDGTKITAIVASIIAAIILSNEEQT